MIEYKTVEVPAKKVKRFHSMSCDLCGEKTYGNDNWTNETFNYVETEISMEEGVCYPEGGEKVTTEFHICGDCFKGKLIPWLESSGAKPTVEETEW